MIRTHAALLVLLLMVSWAGSAAAQTTLGGQPPVSTSPPGRMAPGRASPGSAAQQAAPVPRQPMPVVPMSPTVYEQALQQSDGQFPEMERAPAGGQIQEAWNLSEPRTGVYVTRLCEDCVYKIRTREMMTTTVVLPEDAVITTADLGDPVGFRVQVKTATMLAVRPTAYGLDTNLNVYSKAGRVYPFYVRSEGINSKHVPDLMVRILGREKPDAIVGIGDDGGSATATADKPSGQVAAAVDGLVNPAPAKGEFVRSAPFDPGKLHGWKDYKLSGDGDLKPETVFRDDHFTYIRYGKSWDRMELSTAYVTIDGIDELVNSRVQGSTFIVESVNPLITLKNGKRYLCIQYTGETP